MNLIVTDIQINNLSKSFNGKSIINNLSIQIPRSSKVSITGMSGSGKSTLVNILLGFVIPDYGTVNLLGFELNALNISKIRSQISWLPQELQVDINNVTDLIRLPFCYHNNKNHKPHSASIIFALERFGLDREILNSEVQEISGGEKQRIFLAASSLLERKIYFLDEPTSALDRESKNKVMDYFLKKCSATIVAVTHDQDWVDNSDMVLDMDINEVDTDE